MMGFDRTLHSLCFSLAHSSVTDPGGCGGDECVCARARGWRVFAVRLVWRLAGVLGVLTNVPARCQDMNIAHERGESCSASRHR